MLVQITSVGQELVDGLSVDVELDEVGPATSQDHAPAHLERRLADRLVHTPVAAEVLVFDN